MSQEVIAVSILRRYNTGPTPACPACGCRDAEVFRLPNPERWAQGQARCRHCDTVFSFLGTREDEDQAEREEKVRERDGNKEPVYRIVRERLRCPACRSTDVSVSTTRAEQVNGSILRYHVCRACAYRFSSIER